MAALGWLLNLGFAGSGEQVGAAFELSLRARSKSVTLDGRDVSLNLKTRSRTLSAPDRD